MKRFLLSLGLMICTAAPLTAQMGKKPVLSPPEEASATIAGQTISIKYSSPKVRGREGHLFGPGGRISHDPHYPVWRAGANAATTLTTSADLTIGKLNVPKGTYTLFVNVADPNHWVLIVNKQTGEWGLAYNGSYDLGTVPMHMQKPGQMAEDLLWTITAGHGKKGMITLSWENYSASVPFKVH